MKTKFDSESFNASMQTIARINLENRVQHACNLWNECTNPAALKSDRKHSRDMKNARTLKRIIRKAQEKGIRVREWSNGALYVERL